MRVILSDSDDDSDESTDDANVTKRSQSSLDSNTKPSIADASDNSDDGDPSNASNNSSEDDLSDVSGKSDDETPSAVKKKRDQSHLDSEIHSDTNTLSSIEGSHAVKRKADKWGIDPHNIIFPSHQASNESIPSQDHDERQGKRLRVTRGYGQSTVNYDMKHHPMDDILRPKYSAKRRGNGSKIPEDSSDSDEEIDGDETNDTPSGKVTSLKTHRRRSSRNIQQSETSIYNAKWHPLDQMLRDNTSSMRISKKVDLSKRTRKTSSGSSPTLKDEADSMAVTSDFDPDADVDRASEMGGETTPINPDRRRSARVLSSKDAPPNYDMKYCDPILQKSTLRLITLSRYHVMDSTLRPKAAAKRMKSKMRAATPRNTPSKSASSAKTHIKQLAKASPKSSMKGTIHPESESDNPDVSVAPAWSQLQNPYLNRSSLDWAEIQEMDRYMYLLQKGAPLHGDTLPQDWTHKVVKKVLFDEGVITLDELNSREGTELLKLRYESVRLGVQNFFGSRPEPVKKKEWTLSKAEGFDVYDMKRGSKYWRHQSDSILEGTKTSSSSNNLGFAAQMAKHMSGNNNNEATSYVPEGQYRNEAITSTSMEHTKSDGTNRNESCSPRPPAWEVDSERTLSVDRDGVIIETEDTLVESMRGEYVPSSIMSDAALEELLFPVEQYSREKPDQEVTADLVSSDSRRSEPAGLITAHLDKTLFGKEKTMSGVDVGPRDTFCEPQTPKAEVKTRKRKLRVEWAITVHEDLPGRTPLVRRIVGMNPASPGTDIPKENLQDDGYSNQVEMGTPRALRYHEAVGTPSTRRLSRFGSATSATPPYRSVFGGSPNS